VIFINPAWHEVSQPWHWIC